MTTVKHAILVVDDDHAHRTMLRALIGGWGDDVAGGGGGTNAAGKGGTPTFSPP